MRRALNGATAGYDSLVAGAQPVEDLVQPCAVLPSAGALPDQRGVSGKDHALPDTTVPLPANLAIVELHEDQIVMLLRV